MLISLKDSFETFNFNHTITYGEYYNLLYTLLNQMVEEVLAGEKLQTPFGTFSILLKENEFKRKGVNYAASMKRKQEIIDAGGIPYSKETGEGEKYLQYFTKDHYFFISIGRNRRIQIGNIKYKFVPFRSFNYKKQRKLKESNSIHLKYATY